ncbi:SAM-dependent methyltransferase [Corynebacterium aquatimens]|uniref:SAM-dependent methyltransferase n=1 Tax=Corynebacterium aquatimens TaxID=1190508 RepID=UPI0033132F30
MAPPSWWRPRAALKLLTSLANGWLPRSLRGVPRTLWRKQFLFQALSTLRWSYHTSSNLGVTGSLKRARVAGITLCAIEKWFHDIALYYAPAGKVIFVGAGPGNPDLLTIRAREVLEANAIALVDPEVSQGSEALLPRSCRCPNPSLSRLKPTTKRWSPRPRRLAPAASRRSRRTLQPQRSWKWLRVWKRSSIRCRKP